MVALYALGQFLGPLAASVVLDQTGSYAFAFWIGVGVAAAAALLLSSLTPEAAPLEKAGKSAFTVHLNALINAHPALHS